MVNVLVFLFEGFGQHRKEKESFFGSLSLDLQNRLKENVPFFVLLVNQFFLLVFALLDSLNLEKAILPSFLLDLQRLEKAILLSF